MALPEPPTNVPRIVDVQDPGTGHYVVMVRMPTQLAAKFPDKPWGTKIAAIGLAKQDSDRFPGYTLVDVEPLKGSPDLYWIFQKLNGPVWTTKSKGQESLVPAKYRRLVTTTRSKQEVTPDTEPSDIVAPIKSSVVEQQDDTGKAVKVNTEGVIDVDGDPLVGKQMVEYGIADTSESLVEEGSDLPDFDYLTLSLSQDPIGDGTSVLSTTSIDSFPVLESTEILQPYNIPVLIEKQIVPAGTRGSANNNIITEVRSLDYLRSIQIKSTIGFGSLPVPETFPKDVRYKFPDVLNSIVLVVVATRIVTLTNVQNAAIDIAFDIKEGPSGSFKGHVVRSFHTGPPSLTGDTLWTPVPKGDTFLYSVLHREIYGGNNTTRTKSGAKSVPPTLHRALQVTRALNFGGVEFLYQPLWSVRFANTKTNLLPATAITDLPASGSTILIDRNSERIRGNIWVLEKTFLTMP